MAAVGTLTMVSSEVRAGLYVYTFSWTSDAAGNVSGTTFPLAPGTIVSLEFQPGTGGSQPTNLYNVVLNDDMAVDLLGGSGAGLSNAANSITTPRINSERVYHHGGSCELKVSAAGNAKSGVVVVYIAPGIL